MGGKEGVFLLPSIVAAIPRMFLMHPFHHLFDSCLVRLAPRVAGEELAQTFQTADQQASRLDLFFCVLRTRRVMTAVSVGMYMPQRAVIGGECGLVERDQCKNDVAGEADYGVEQIAHVRSVGRLWA